MGSCHEVVVTWLMLTSKSYFCVVSRDSLLAIKWGCTMLRTFHYINALTGKSVLEGLRDRKTRFVFLQALTEMDRLFRAVLASVAAANKKSERKSGDADPDTSAATLFSVRSLTVLLPLPDWIFNHFVLRMLDLGLGAPFEEATSVITVRSVDYVSRASN